MNYKNIFITLIIALFALSQLFAEENKHFKANASVEVKSVKKAEKFNVLLKVSFDKNWYTYSLKEQEGPDGIGPTATVIDLVPENKVVVSGKITSSKPHKKYDEAFEIDIEYFKGNCEFSIPAIAKKDIDFSKEKLFVLFDLQQCEDERCLPPSAYQIPIKFEGSDIQTEESIASATEEAESEEASDIVAASQDSAEKVSMKTESQSEIESKKKEGVFAFLLFAMTAGALALLTPCVFPMVPITVSFFTKRAEKEKSRGLRDSLVYTAGIVVTFTALGFILATIFGATGIQEFATNPFLNMFIAAIFIIFALNLFGAFELQLPTGLLNKLNRKSEGGGILGVLLMGLTFSLTSFTCTVPFVGVALVAASGGEWFYPILGMLGFSTVFAAPFFLLALFPSAMNKMPKAGGWMNNIKVVMGLLEIAAAIKFISNADLVWSWGLMPRELFIGIWIACSLLIVLYILGIFRLPHDSPVEKVGTPRIVISIFFASIGFFLFAGLTGKPLGELDAFLPPPNYYELMSASAGDPNSNPEQFELKDDGKENKDFWHNNYENALSEAKEKNIALFVDFTGFTCTNCRWMELNMFSKPEVQSLLKQMVKVKLYTDRREEPYVSNKKMQQERFNSIELPLYVILTPNEEFIATKAFTRDEREFLDFLKKGLLR